MGSKDWKCIGGGKCSECGRCNRGQMTTRKMKLTYLPEDFLPELEDGDKDAPPLCGLAFDIGTTTVVGMLWDLNTNEMIDIIAKTNPQSTYGADVISRITFSGESTDNLQTMKTLIRDCMNEMIKEFSEKYQFDTSIIWKATVVGNTTMSHLFLGIDPSSLARAPYHPAFEGSVQKTGAEMSININPEAIIYLLPNIAGHVGSDIVGVLLASRLKRLPGLRLAIDVGTNGEIVLSHNGKMLTCSTAAGPAFEGASIYQGMRASKGSIEGVEIVNGDVEIKVIENAKPVGICGSGLIDAVAAMLEAGVINFRGNIISFEDAKAAGFPEKILSRIRRGERGNEFVLAWATEGEEDIILTQNDIREVQLAKGAIFAGIDILMQCLEVESTILEEIILAGAFGNYISKKSAIRIGMFPEISEDKIRNIGNAAGAGACMALLSKKEMMEAELQSKEIEHVELANHPSFEKVYLKAMYFPK